MRREKNKQKSAYAKSWPKEILYWVLIVSVCILISKRTGPNKKEAATQTQLKTVKK